MAKRVAVIGLSFRFPNTDAEHYWQDLIEGKNLVREVAPDRWSQDAYLHPAREHPGTAYTFAAGSLGDIAGFDAAFFGISPREAQLMDPQQRLLLELCWETLENAGIPASRMRGSNCGVYIGISSADYSYRMADDLGAIDASTATGNTASIAANRLSYVFDLHGPSMAVDTACSSAMVAFHQACQAIATGEISQALTGGVSLHLHPYGFVTFSKATMLSPEGRCKVFDASGDGYVRSEGGGLFLLKDFDQAVADGDNILAVVAGTAVNTDGHKSGLTVPNVDAQATLMREVYRRAGIEASAIDYLEAHGTGTPVGDPIETRAIGLALGQARTAEMPLPIGSVKSNLGHLEAASGVAGLVKSIFCLRHRTVPATIGIRTLNPNIRTADWNIDVVTQPRALRQEGPLTIGVNSFGFGGANAHVILQSPDIAAPAKTARLVGRSPLPLVISARERQGLNMLANDMASWLRDQADAALYDIAYQAAMRRDWHEERAVFFGNDSEDFARQLEQFAQDDGTIVPRSAYTNPTAPKGPVFSYSGNGSQWVGMGRQLVHDPIFAQAVREIDTHFVALAGWSLAEHFTQDSDVHDSLYDATEVAQPALFAIQVGVTCMLVQLGVEPVAVLGHSVGEVAAAWACGALTLADATRVIYERSHAQGRTRGLGRMAAVGISGNEAQTLIAELGLTSLLCVAGYNSKDGSTLAGELQALEQIGYVLIERQIFYRLLDLDYAFHSPAMDAVQAPLVRALEGLSPQVARIPFHSTVTGGLLDTKTLTADYWWNNIRMPVRYEPAVAGLVEAGFNVHAEIGPAPVLRSYLNTALRRAAQGGMVAVSGKRGEDSPIHVRACAAQLMASGATVQWSRVFPWVGNHVGLPGYPWQRERYWHPVTTESFGQLERRRVHPLLGYPLLQQSQTTWENSLDTQYFPWLADHIVGNATLFPGSGFVEIALAAMRQWLGESDASIEELEIHAPLLLAASPSKLTRLSIDESDGRFRLRSKDTGSNDGWIEHASGRVIAGSQPPEASAPPLPGRRPDFTGETHLKLTRMVELTYGPAFQAVSHGWIQGSDAVLAILQTPEALTESLPGSLLHPALLDCAFQLIIHLLKNDTQADHGIAFVPAKISQVRWRPGLGVPHLVRARLRRRAPHSVLADYELYDADGRQIAIIEGVRLRSVRLAKTSSDPIAFLDYAAIPLPHPLALPASNHALHGDALTKVVRDVAGELARDDALLRYTQEIEPLLESLCDHYTATTLCTLGRNGQIGPQHLEHICNTEPAMRPVLQWMLERVAQRRPDRAGWQVDSPQDDDASPEDIWNDLLREYPDYFPIVQSVGRIGLRLKDLLAGRITWQDALPRGVTPARLARGIFGNAARRQINAAVVQRLAEAQRSRQPGQRLSIVEIGMDEPFFADSICPTLDFTVADYLYASPEADALEGTSSLRERFPAFQVRGLDANLSLPDTRADLILLFAGFDSRERAQQLLTRARAWLKPGGTLLLVGTQPAAWMNFVFGGQAGWWSHDANEMIRSAQYPASHWQTVLPQLSMQCQLTLELAPGASSGPYLVVASLPERDALAPNPPTLSQTGGWIILADAAQVPHSALVDGLVEQLADSHGQTVLVRTDVDPDTLNAILIDAREALGEVIGIIHLAGLSLPRSRPKTRHGDLERACLAAQVRRCDLAARLAQACERMELSTTLWLVTAGAAPFLAPADQEDDIQGLNDASLWLFGRTLINEAAGFDVRLVDLPMSGPLPLEALAREILWPTAEQEIALGPMGERHVPRLRRRTRPQRPAAKPQPRARLAIHLGFESPGQLRNLRWQQAPMGDPAEHEIEVQVQATGLNFRDVMYTLGLLSDEAIENGFAGPTLGLEFAGVVDRVGTRVIGYKPGDAVVGFGPASFSDRLLTTTSAIARIPENMSVQAAATIPSAFFTVYYALHHLAHLEAGEKILIHGAAGGVGIAAIQYAQWLGAEVHATAGSDEKRDFLRLMGVEHIYDSRSLTFGDQVLANTDGTGVDVVLNSLAGEAINQNLRILKPFGRFLELGKRDFYENTRIGLRPFRNNISYFGIDADQLMAERPDLTHRLFNQMMALFHDDVLHPLPYRVFEAENVVDAFRHMQQARQIGKIVVTYPRMPASEALEVAPTPRKTLILPEQATYLVTGGLAGFGLRTAGWLADKGARHLVLISRSGPASDEARTAIDTLRKRGVHVEARACDVTDRTAMQVLFDEMAQTLPPLRGIVHAAMVIDDGLIANMSATQIERVMAPKIVGALLLDELSRQAKLDFFVLFSSGTTLFGNPGQASYVAANGWLEALARRRRAAGLPATCPRWGAIDDAGFLARNVKVKDALQARMGGSALPAAVALQALEDMLLADEGDLGVLELDWRALARFLPSALSPKFQWLAREVESGSADEDSSGDIGELVASLDDAALHPVVLNMLKKEIGTILRVPVDKVDPERSVYDMGLDSLMGVELIVALENIFGIRLSVMALSESVTLAKLADRLIVMLRSDAGGTHDEIADQVVEVVSIHAEGEGVTGEAIDAITEALKATDSRPQRSLIT